MGAINTILVVFGVGVAVAVLAWLLSSSVDWPSMRCPHCGVIAAPKAQLRGSDGTSILLLVLFFPAFVGYEIWRRGEPKWICPKCDRGGMRPLAKAQAVGTGFYLISGVRRDTRADTSCTIKADTEANARVKAELDGIVVTHVEFVTPLPPPPR